MRRILTILMLVAVSAAAAQERFDHIFRRNPWNGGLNAAGIRQDSLSRSYAEIYFTKENGGLAGHSASDDSWNAGAKTESVRHLKKVSFSAVSATTISTAATCAARCSPSRGYYPVDILEFTPGRKVREDYTFTGGVSAVLGNRWTGGLRVEFEARNYAKRKDLRHKNTRLDFEFSPGVMYHAGRFAVGAVYIVGTNSEKVAAEGVGPGADLYEAFFDRGLLYGSLEKWGSTDIHLSTNGVSGFPVRENTQGGRPVAIRAVLCRRRLPQQAGRDGREPDYLAPVRNAPGDGQCRPVAGDGTAQAFRARESRLADARHRREHHHHRDHQRRADHHHTRFDADFLGAKGLDLGRRIRVRGSAYGFACRGRLFAAQPRIDADVPLCQGAEAPLYEDICLADPHVRPLGADPRGGLSPGRFHGARKAVRDPRRAAGRVSPDS